MSATNYLPPHHHLHPARPIHASEALANIQSYLEQSTTQPHLHPDCVFGERDGPAFSSTASLGGVVLQQLRRVEAGLRGVWLGVDPEVEFALNDGTTKEFVGTGDAGVVQESNVGRRKNGGRHLADGDGGGDVLEEEDGMGDNVANYQEQLGRLGEHGLVGEIGARSNAVGNITRIPQVQSTIAGGGDGGSRKRNQDEYLADTRPLNVKERKAAKKARRKEEKADRAGQRMDGRDEEEGRVEDVDGDVEMEQADEMLGTQQGLNGNGVHEKLELPNGHGAAQSTSLDTSRMAQDEKARRKAEKLARKNSRGEDGSEPRRPAVNAGGTAEIEINGTTLEDTMIGTKEGDEDDVAKRKADKRARKLAKLEKSRTKS